MLGNEIESSQVKQRNSREVRISNSLCTVCYSLFLTTHLKFAVVTGSSSYLKSDVMSDKPVIVGDLVSTAWFRHYKL